MPVAPRISASPLMAAAARYPAGVPVAPVDPTPMTEAVQREPLSADESLIQYEDLVTGEERRAPAQQVRVFSLFPEVPRSNLFVETAQGFAEAFSLVERGSTAQSELETPPASVFSLGIETYEFIGQVIHGALPPRGENLSMLL